MIFLHTFLLLKNYSQINTAQEINFINHLINIQEYDDAIYLLNQFPNDSSMPLLLCDSIYFLKGWAYYNQKKLTNSVEEFLKISEISPFYYKSRFFTAYNYSYLKEYQKSKNLLTQLNQVNANHNKLKNFELAGIALLERDSKTFQTLSENFTYDYYPLVKEEKQFDNIYTEINNYKIKSALLSGFLSSIIPGLGKVYSEKTAQGVSAFLISGILALITYENYSKKGLNNYRTIISGSLFSVFYIGNIWGSVYSAKFSNNEFNTEIDQKILFNLHIPLRTIFN